MHYGFQVLVYTCSGPVVGLLVFWPVDELPQGGDGIGANQSVAAKSPAVHHPDVQWWVKQLILRQILTHKLQNYLIDENSLIGICFCILLSSSFSNLHGM